MDYYRLRIKAWVKNWSNTVCWTHLSYFFLIIWLSARLTVSWYLDLPLKFVKLNQNYVPVRYPPVKFSEEKIEKIFGGWCLVSYNRNPSQPSKPTRTDNEWGTCRAEAGGRKFWASPVLLLCLQPPVVHHPPIDGHPTKWLSWTYPWVRLWNCQNCSKNICRM